MSTRSLQSWFFDDVDYRLFKMEDCWHLSATEEGKRHGKQVALDEAAVVELMSLIDDVEERTKRAKRLLGC